MLNFFRHLKELKLKLIYFFISFTCTFFSSYSFMPELIYLAVSPLFSFVRIEDSDFIFTSVFEILNLYIALSFTVSIFFSAFILCYLIFSYLKSGLFLYEKNIFFLLLKCVFFSSFLSIGFIFFVFLPLSLSFLLSLNLILNTKFFVLKMNLRLYEYLILVFQFCFVYSFTIFQLPLALFFYININIKNFRIEFLYSKRRLWLLFGSLLSLLTSSPDLVSLLLTFIPLVLAFEVITFSFIIKKSYQAFI